MTIVSLARRVHAVQYDGTNVADLNTLAASFNAVQGGPTNTISLATSTGFRINYLEGGVIYGYEDHLTGEWMVCDLQIGALFIWSTAQVNARYYSYDQAAALLAATDSFKAAVAAQASGFGAVPSITVNGLSNANFDVPIRPVQPSTAFTATPFLTGSSSLLGSLAITGLTAGTVPNANKLSTVIGGVTVYDRVRVNVANSGALQLAGAALLCHVSP